MVLKSNAAILFVQTAFLGDLLLSIPALKRIKLVYPYNPIYLVCRKGLGSLLLHLQVCDQVFEVEKNNSESYRKVKDQLKLIEFEKIISPHESMTSAMLVSKLKAKDKISYRHWWNFLFYNHRIKKNTQWPEALRQMELLTVFDLDLKNKMKDYLNTDLLGPIPDWSNTQVQKYLGDQNWVCIFPGSVWPTKMWTMDGFIELGKYLNHKNYKVILLGSAQEKELCEQIASHLSSVQNMAGKTNLMQTLHILSQSQAVVSNDSGGQHLASLCAVPTVSIFGPTVLSQGFRPWNSNIQIAELKSLHCRPCGKHGHKKCPLGTHECMKKLPVQNVIEKLEILLKLRV